MMSHNWSVRAPVYTSDSFWTCREPGGAVERICIRMCSDTPRNNNSLTHTQKVSGLRGEIFSLSGLRERQVIVSLS